MTISISKEAAQSMLQTMRKLLAEPHTSSIGQVWYRCAFCAGTKTGKGCKGSEIRHFRNCDGETCVKQLELALKEQNNGT
jgi:hypothetical protein